MTDHLDLTCSETLRDSPPAFHQHQHIHHHHHHHPPSAACQQQAVKSCSSPPSPPPPPSSCRMFSVLTVNPTNDQCCFQENNLANVAAAAANTASTSTANVASKTTSAAAVAAAAAVREFFPPLPAAAAVGHFISLPTAVTNTGTPGLKQGFLLLDKKTAADVMPIKSESLLPFRNNLFSQNSFPSVFSEETNLSPVAKVFNLTSGYQVNTKQCSSGPHESSFQQFQGSRPLTLQVNTVRGPALVQLQHTRPFPKNAKGGAPAGNSSSCTADYRPVAHSVISAAKTVDQKNASVAHPAAAAPSPAEFSRYGSSATVYDAHLERYYEAAAVAQSPHDAAASVQLPSLSPGNGLSLGNCQKTLFVSVCGSHVMASNSVCTSSRNLASSSCPAPLSLSCSSSSSSAPSSLQTFPCPTHYHRSPCSTSSNGSLSVSPSNSVVQTLRPSILRKRVSESVQTSASSSSVVPRKILYEPVSLAKRAAVSFPQGDDQQLRVGPRPAVVALRDSLVESVAGGAARLSAAVAAEQPGGGGGSFVATSVACASPSPRKRPRKQQLSSIMENSDSSAPRDREPPPPPAPAPPTAMLNNKPASGSALLGDLNTADFLRSMKILPPSSSAPPPPSAAIAAPPLPSPVPPVSTAESSSSDSGSSASQPGIPSPALDKESSTTSCTVKTSSVPSRSKDTDVVPEDRRQRPEYRPLPMLKNAYQPSWDARRQHFLCYEDVKRKEEKPSSSAMDEVRDSGEKRLELGGWKVRLMSAQLKKIHDFEKYNLDLVSAVLDLLKDEAFSTAASLTQKQKDTLREMVLTNMRRVQVVLERTFETRSRLTNVLKHEDFVRRFLNAVDIGQSPRNGGKSSSLPR